MPLAPLLRAEERFLDRLGHLRGGADPRLNRAIARFSSAGEYGRIWFALAGVGHIFDRKHRRDWSRAVGNVLTAYGLGLVFKNLIRRQRPIAADGPALVSTPTQLSFPSSHATTSFASAAAFRPLVTGRFGSGASFVVTILATAMTASRVYLGVHYPSDVVAGAVLGTVVGRRGPFRRP